MAHPELVVAMVTAVVHLCARVVENGIFKVQSAGDLVHVNQARVTPFSQESLNSVTGSIRPCVIKYNTTAIMNYY